jgi:hypothetical protein
MSVISQFSPRERQRHKAKQGKRKNGGVEKKIVKRVVERCIYTPRIMRAADVSEDKDKGKGKEGMTLNEGSKKAEEGRGKEGGEKRRKKG